MKRVTRHLLTIALLCHGLPLCAQSAAPRDSLPDSTAQRVPSPPSLADTAKTPVPMKKSPSTALLLSAIVPGAGQFYNGSYWKVPIVLGFGIYFVSSWLDNNRRYQDYRDKYEQSLSTNPPSGDERLLALREFYKDQRDTFTWYFLILYIINLADAYVDASLSDFDVGGNLSIRTVPEMQPLPGQGSPSALGSPLSTPPGPRIELRLKF